MTDTYRAAVLVAPRRFETWDLPAPKLSSDDALLAVEACGVCGSDVPPYTGEPAPADPMILGHEIVGRVIDAGPTWSGPPAGTRVVVERWIPCGHCDLCLSGWYRFCVPEIDGHRLNYGGSPTTLSPSLWGGFAEALYLHPNAVLYPIAPDVPAHVAPLYTPLGNAISWLQDLGAMRAGDVIAIEGPGQEGLCAVLAAHLLGAAQVIVLGKRVDKGRLQLAEELGVDCVVSVDDEDPVDVVAEITHGRGVDIVLDVTSAANGEPTNLALELAAFGGRVVLGGIHPSVGPDLDSHKIVDKALTVRGARGRERWALKAAIRAIEADQLPFERLCAPAVGLEHIDEAFRMVSRENETDAVHVSVVP